MYLKIPITWEDERASYCSNKYLRWPSKEERLALPHVTGGCSPGFIDDIIFSLWQGSPWWLVLVIRQDLIFSARKQRGMKKGLLQDRILNKLRNPPQAPLSTKTVALEMKALTLSQRELGNTLQSTTLKQTGSVSLSMYIQF